MRAGLLDRHARRDSPLHRAPAAAKLAVALALIVGAVRVPPDRAWLLAVGAAIVLGAAWVSRVPWRFLAGRLLLLEPFVLGVALLAAFQPGGWRLAGFLVARSTICLATMIVLAATTPFAELLRLARRAHVPALLVTTLSLLERYLFVLLDEAARMRRARASRTFSSRRGRAWQVAASVVGELFVRSSERAERIHAAMCARGWR